jgi:hypothetical protein
VIYTIYHQARPHESTDACQAIFVGRPIGNNIAHLETLAEMRAHFWIWKNKNPMFWVGFQHYRRYLDLRNTDSRAKIEVTEPQPQEEIPAWVEDFDVIVPRAWQMNRNLTVGEQFCEAHGNEAWNQMLALVPDFERYSKRNSYHVCNIFLTRWEIFARYMEFWWDLSQSLLRTVSVPENSYQHRILGFLSERIWSFWLDREQERTGIKIFEVPLMLVTP